MTIERRPVFYFVGDSLTQDGGNPETSGWITILQHKHIRSVDAINRGLSGYNTRWFIDHALPVLVNELKSGQYTPSLVTLWLGANDAALPTGDAAIQHVTFNDYRANMTLILRTLAPLLPSDAKILLITPPAVIDAARRAVSNNSADLDRCNEAAGVYARVCVEVGKAEGVAVLDLHTFFNATFPQEAERAALFSDGLHFTSKGNVLVAQQVASKIKEMFNAEQLARFDASQLPLWRDFIV